MIRYTLHAANSENHLLGITATFEQVDGKAPFLIQLPAWRPGRYELGNFAKNIQQFKVTNQAGQTLEFEKITKDQWKINPAGATAIVVSYTYYAADLNAGSTYLDETQLYVNPVNCCVYNPPRAHETLKLELDIPANYEIACGLPREDHNTLVAPNFDELVDSPFIASPNLKHIEFTAGNLPVHVWLQGECRPDVARITNDFTRFMQWQLNVFGQCPATEYHYLIQILPVTFYHGVEHRTSTVLALGPGYALNENRYKDLLGVACHEFYHVWNIKTIRPAEMWPYDFTTENYFTTGFVAEGVTTYMGDYILWQSGVFSDDDFFAEMNNQLQKHFDNHGRFNHSVTQSGFDTWLDGYVPGVPDRKVSIYTEGCLIALMTDVLIAKHTHCGKSLHDVMRKLYTDFYLQHKGYTYTDYVNTVSAVAGYDMHTFFETFALHAHDFKPMLQECLEYLGLEMTETEPVNAGEKIFGFKLAETPEKSLVTAIYPGSPAHTNALALHDQLVGVNGYAVKGDGHKWLNYFAASPSLGVTVIRGGRLLNITLAAGKATYYPTYKIARTAHISADQEALFNYWKNKK